MLSPIENLVKTIMTLVSLIPSKNFNLKWKVYYSIIIFFWKKKDLIENGLNECTLIDEKSNDENEINFNENEDIVFSRNDDDDEQLNFDKIKLKTLKMDDDERSSTASNDLIENKNDEYIKNNLLKRATSITNKLSDTFNRLTTTTNIMQNCSQDLTHLDQFQFPIQLFKKVFIYFFKENYFFLF